mgnify:CR=1 FL=1
MKKKAYMKPAMQVVALKQHSHLLAGSPVQRVSNSEGLGWKSDGFGDSDDDY